MIFQRFALGLVGGLVFALQAQATDITRVTSPSGVEAWLVEDHSIPFAAINLAFRGGASVDPEGQRGAINLMTHVLEEGAGEMDATEYASAVEALGARIGFDVGDDALTVSIRLLSETRDEGADLVNAALTEPRFDDAAVARVKGQVMAVIRAEENDPNAIAAKALAAAIWGDHPYGSSINGTADSVMPLSPDDLRAAKDRVLARDRVIVGAAGDIDAEELGLLIDRMLDGLPQTATAPLPAQATFAPQGGVMVIDWNSPQTVFAFAQPGVSLDDPDYFSAYLADHILGGGGFSSRLMEEIREKRGLTYGVSTALSNGVSGSSWRGGMAASNASAGEALALLRAEWAKMAEGGVTDQELADAKTYLTGEYPLRWDGNGKIAGILAGMQLIGLPIDYPDTRNAQIESVTAEDVARIAAEVLDPDRLQIVLVGQPEGVSP
ncbi:M16 family metallopeptidase [Paracoccus jeotgali]|uniref:Peptidase M16 n=1 Tax=Paracoccus jeotgali TaxID=2065379 RepID=A0A2K9MH05_9RHOB|nr:pitrilysin family protein [Paracoccus jeotgali]AUM74927.1 peptidase M16 [Paracoccus jeotgali]